MYKLLHKLYNCSISFDKYKVPFNKNQLQVKLKASLAKHNRRYDRLLDKTSNEIVKKVSMVLSHFNLKKRPAEHPLQWQFSRCNVVTWKVWNIHWNIHLEHSFSEFSLLTCVKKSNTICNFAMSLFWETTVRRGR